MNDAIFIGLIFGPLAACMAFVISFKEYSHHYPDTKTPVLLSLKSAIVTLIVFAVITIAAGYFIPRITKQ